MESQLFFTNETDALPLGRIRQISERKNQYIYGLQVAYYLASRASSTYSTPTSLPSLKQ